MWCLGLLLALLYPLSAMKLAVVGGGFAGLATAKRLAKHCSAVHIFDPRPPGKAASSSISGGLMNPVAPKGNIMWKGIEGMQATRNMLAELRDQGFTDLVKEDVTLLRPVFSQADVDIWNRACSKTPNLIDRVDSGDARLRKLSPETLACYRIKDVTVFNPSRYLSALRQSVQRECANSKWIRSTISHVSEVASAYDHVVLANAYDLPRLWSQAPPGAQPPSPLRVLYVRGRIFQYPLAVNGRDVADCALLGGEYIVPSTDGFDQEVLSCGSSHEHFQEDYLQDTPEVDYVYRDRPALGDEPERKLLDRLHKLLPALESLQPIATSSSMRLVMTRTHHGRLPIAGQHPCWQNVWLLAGLGSKGLVYHALMADLLAAAVVADDPDLIPVELRVSNHYN